MKEWTEFWLRCENSEYAETRFLHSIWEQASSKDQRHLQEKWVTDRTQHIREATARGLEPELRRLMSQHQIELQSLRAIHQDELLRAEQQQLTKTAQQLNALRERLDAERDEACVREREHMRSKFEKQLDEMESIHVVKFQRLQVPYFSWYHFFSLEMPSRVSFPF